MKALILNSGMGKRMGTLTSKQPKCMTKINVSDTILSRQLKLLQRCNVTEIIITTGYFHEILIDYCNSLNLQLKFTFIKNPMYDRTNYIYSIYLAKDHLEDNIVLLHGDLVFELEVLQDILKQEKSCMTVSSTRPLPAKDFKAVVKNGLIEKIGVEFFDNAITAQPLYKINSEDWKIWLNCIINYCENDQVNCYAENAFNEVSSRCNVYPMDFEDRLCTEIDTPQDLVTTKERLSELIY